MSLYAIRAIDPMETYIGGDGMFTDGIWVWPSYLPFYIEYFNVHVEDEFYLYMKSNNFEVYDKRYSLNNEAILNYVRETLIDK